MATIGDGLLETSHPELGTNYLYSSAYFQEPDAPHKIISDSNGTSWYGVSPPAEMSGGDAPPAVEGTAASTGLLSEYSTPQINQFLPNYDNTSPVSKIDTSRWRGGVFEVLHADGSAASFYDTNRYRSPSGGFKVYQDVNGCQWYAAPGRQVTESRTVFNKDGSVSYQDGKVRKAAVSLMKYDSTPTRFQNPEKRSVYDRRPPERKHRP
jgi:hypothetical protein